MKKKIIPFLFSMFLLASCGAKECKTHDYGDWTTTKEAACGEAGTKERTCKTCGAKDTGTIDALSHNYQDAASQEGAVAPTCTAPGTVVTECSNCHAKSTREVAATGVHDYQDAANQEGAVAPTCGATGTVITECSVCHAKSTRVAEKLTEHTFGDVVEVTPATHAAEGKGKKTCSVCNSEVEVTLPRLADHSFGEEKVASFTADHDLIGYDVYNCATDNVKKIVWNANDVTLATKREKYNNEDNYKVDGEGVKFGGRPIGNARSLPATNANGNVFDASVPGAFVEYKINVDSSMVGAQLISDMKPAQWLNNQAGLFLSAPSGSDWTPGMVADDDPTNTDGYKMTEFRYVIYVNGKEVAMDASKNVSANDARNRGWYNFPCTVDLKKGENTIRLVQAGGWEATFYSFGVVSASAVTNVIPAASEGFTVAVAGDEHVTGIKVFEDKLCTIEDTADTHYSRNEFGRKLNDGDGQISFEVTVAEGYKVKGIEQLSPTAKAYKNFKFPTETIKDNGGVENIYRITKIEDNISVKVITEPADVVKTGFEVTFVKGAHVASIEVYKDNTFADASKIEGLVATSVDKSSMEPTTVADQAQVYIKITFEDGYQLDADAITYSTEAKPFNKVEEVTVGSGNYKFTKVNASATITIAAKAIVA